MTRKEILEKTIDFDDAINRIVRLEEENAELKAVERMALYSKMSDQLTKAKTYLKYFIEILKKLGANKEPLVIEAEQFLKGESDESKN